MIVYAFIGLLACKLSYELGYKKAKAITELEVVARHYMANIKINKMLLDAGK